jgi:hypothetical protein
MVDTERRKKLAFHLRQLSVGLITNDDFEERVINDVTKGWLPEQYYRAKEAKSDDQIIMPMLELCWSLYSDTKRHKLTGRYKLTDKQLKDIARYILFLHSDLEYEYPYMDVTNPLIKFSFKDLLLTVLTLGQNIRDEQRKREQEIEEIKVKGDIEVWPFFLQQDYEAQLKKHPFLAGRESEHLHQTKNKY